MRWNTFRNYGVTLALVVGGLWSAGCSSMSVFHNYPSQVNTIIDRVKNNCPVNEKIFVRGTRSKDKTLYLMERGRVSQLYGEVTASKTDFKDAIASIREDDDKARISMSDTAAQAAAVLLNDNAIPYNTPGYERVMVHYFQAINYLSGGDIDGARVEIANADAEQKSAEEIHARQIEKAERKRAKSQNNEVTSGQADSGQSIDMVTASLSDKYAGLDEVIGKMKNSFQNGAAYYLSGLIYESLKDNNNAYISYKQALELFPKNKTLQKDVARIALQDARSDDLAEFKSRFSLSADDIKRLVAPEGSGCLVVLYENGFVAQKSEIKIPVPLINPIAVRNGAFGEEYNGSVTVAFPIYNIRKENTEPLTVKEGDITGKTMLVCNVNALVVKNLKEKIPTMVIRQVARCIAKAATTKVANDRVGMFGTYMASAFAYVTENADLRSWLTLPRDIQIYRVPLAAGGHQLVFSTNSGINKNMDINVETGKITFVRVINTGNNLIATSSIF